MRPTTLPPTGSTAVITPAQPLTTYTRRPPGPTAAPVVHAPVLAVATTRPSVVSSTCTRPLCVITYALGAGVPAAVTTCERSWPAAESAAAKRTAAVPRAAVR